MQMVCLDYETNGTEFYRKDFEVKSLALSWKEDGQFKSAFSINKEEFTSWLTELSDNQTPIMCFNIAFEMGVTYTQFPSLNLNFAVDVQRLVQVYGIEERPKDEEDDENKEPIITGYGLKDSVRKFLPEYADYEKEAYDWLRQNKPEIKERELGRYLSELPYDILERYNVADVITTYRLHDLLTDYFNLPNVDYDWSEDHGLYLLMCRQISLAKIRGVPVDVKKAKLYANQVGYEIATIDKTFREKYRKEILQIRKDLHEKEQAKFKKKIVTDVPTFNVSSKDHLERLFVGQLALEPKFHTPKGRPSFKSAHLPTWGEPGQMLANRGKRMLVKVQTNNLIDKASYDGRWHVDLRTCGTVTGRLAGAGNLNVQGLARRDKGLMSCILPDEGNVLVSIDLAAGEPSCTAHFTQDENYRAAILDMVGKPPEYRKGLLYIDDIYLMTMSDSPVGKDKMKKAFESKWNGKSFVEQWLEDSEVIKKALKVDRQLHKVCCLGLGYGMGPTKMQDTLKLNGYDLDKEVCYQFFKNYWKIFSGIKRFADRLSATCEKLGYIENTFGFRGTPPPHKAFNFFIQSTVNGIMAYFTKYLLELAPWAKFVTIIHDEIIVEVPAERVDEFRFLKLKAEQMLNETLNWSVYIRTGFAVGGSWYEAK